ncbi:DUF1593 domain-containing protein [Stieleria sp. JC731]|uniref:DUF1593 domain-containing protein n=1 Tax=Pirellulaceae TaxID=2691357 RepID=UPI001E593F61|nr:DUF1593 domain-containing protein [Stieleria sp. JC731]MCC9602603.1 DUF1593 domain-containing protein [Stieleria sp. JC731]
MMYRTITTIAFLIVIPFADVTSAQPSNEISSVQKQSLKGGALAGQRMRVLISTDIGGSDPDDFQSLVHLLLYADVLDIEGLISSPPNAGRLQHIHEVLDAYESDYHRLLDNSGRSFPSPDELRKLSVQGAIASASPKGWDEPSDGSRLLIEKAKANDERPLWVLVWGSLTDVAQAVHDDPSIKSQLRVYSIGSWNTRQDEASRAYLFEQHSDLWWIESDTTFRGMYIGGDQEGDQDNKAFPRRHVQGHGALGDLFWSKKRDIKMGDTPSLLYLLKGQADKPESAHWGGAFVKTDHGPNYWTDNPSPALSDGNRPGAKTVNRWRSDFLIDWQQRMDWLRD